MSNFLNGFQSSVGSSNGKTKKDYNLTEVLGIMQMFKEGLKVSQVSELTGRSVHSLRYKFLEGEIILNGKKVQRSIRQYATLEDLYTAHGEAIPADIEDDVTTRIAEYKNILEGKIVQEVTEDEVDVAS